MEQIEATVAQQLLQSNRFELKYQIDEQAVRGIRQWIRGHLVQDPYMVRAPQDFYEVHSLYLDSDDLVLYRQSTEGLKNRVKLRIRFYDDDPKSPAFLEIKRRTTGVIHKERAIVSRDAAERLLAGQMLTENDLLPKSRDASSVSALRHFEQLVRRMQAGGTYYVSYTREAYVEPAGNHVRLTIDREIESGLYDQGENLNVPHRRVETSVRRPVLEIKFTDRFPDWMQGMVQTLHLQVQSVSKYVAAVQAVKQWRRLA